MQSNSEGECGDGLNFENVRSSQLNPEENNEVNYKWICETCTYENWIAAKCCIMCRTKRHQMAQIISENNVNQGSVGKLVARKLSTPTIAEAAHSDIFKLGTSGSPPPPVLSCSPPNICSSGIINSRSSSPASHYNNIAAYYIAQQHLHQSGAAAVPCDGGSGDQNELHQLKWSCAQCTYLNLPKSPKCIQCLSSRKRISPAVSRNSPVSPRQAGSGGPNNFGDNSLAQTMVYGNNSNKNQHISHPSPPFRPPSTSPPPKTLHNLGTTFDSLRISSLEDPMSNNERNRNNSSPPHSQIQNRNMGIQDKKTQYQLQNKDKNIMLQNRVMSPPIISTVLPPSSASAPTSSSPPPLAACTPMAKKWSCQSCTYENWPKSKNCIICGTRIGKLTFIPESNRESPPPEAASLSQHGNAARNVRPVEPSNLRDQISQISPTLSARSVQTPRYFTQAEIVTNSISTSSVGGSNQHNNCDYERRLLQLRRRLRGADWSWLSACLGVVEGDMNPVEGYLISGGDPTRKLINAEVALLNRPENFAAGHTLVHLAIKFHREDMLATLLSQFDGVKGSSATNIKCVPSYVAPDLASAIRRHISQSLRQRKGHFPCNYICEWTTYSLPSEIEDLPPGTQEQLYSELMDRDAQKELEEDVEGDSGCLSLNHEESLNSAINWSVEIRSRLGSRLYALWNRSAGDCLLDSVLQATWGVFDRDNTLRRAMAESLHEAGQIFYPRWKEWEIQQALDLDYTLDESQLAEDWAGILSLASQPGASLEQIHVFCLAHVLRRPIIVYGVKYVKSWRGENLGFARFEGVYLPLLWERSFCIRSPVALGYTRGHFCALVPPEPVLAGTVGHGGGGAGALLGASNPDYSLNTGLRFNTPNATTNTTNHMAVQQLGEEDIKPTYLPLVTSDRKQFLPIPYLSQSEMGNSEAILRQWLDVRVTDSGIIVAQQNHLKPPLLVAQLTEEWLNHYRKLAQTSTAPLNLRSANNQHFNYNNNNGGNNCMTSNNIGQSNVTRPTVRRTSPTISQHTSAVTATSPVSESTSSSTHTTIVDTGMSGQSIANSIISGNGGGGASNSKGMTNPNSPSNQVCYSSDGDSDEE